MNNDTIVVLDGARTPIGSFGGMFKDVPAFELGATAAVDGCGGLRRTSWLEVPGRQWC